LKEYNSRGHYKNGYQKERIGENGYGREKHVTTHCNQNESGDDTALVSNLLDDAAAKETETGIGKKEDPIDQLGQEVLPTGIECFQVKCELHLILHGDVEIGNKTKDEKDRGHEDHAKTEIAVGLLFH
jgi:hypothetical protein